jgi:hypothetical protein
MPEEIPEVVKIETVPIKHAKDHKLLILVFASVGISLLMVVFSMFLYINTGASQLDLSRPGYVDIRTQNGDKPERFDGFEATGELNKESLNEFSKLYETKLKEIEQVNAFSSDPLSPKSLRIE